MGVAGSIFELHPSNLVRIHIFVSCKDAEIFVTIFQMVQISQNQCGSAPSISCDVLAQSQRLPSPSNCKTTFTKTSLEPLVIEIHPILELSCFTIFQGFLLRYISFSQVNWLKNGSSSKFKECQKCQKYLIKRTFLTLMSCHF